jgi:hypothetical protein
MERTLTVCVLALAYAGCGPVPPQQADDVVPKKWVFPASSSPRTLCEHDLVFMICEEWG